MKDYSLNSHEQTNFIKNYRVKKGRIVSKLSSGKKHYIPYTPENEQRVLGIMEKQVSNIDKKERSWKKLRTLYSLVAGALGVVVAVSLIGYLTSGVYNVVQLIITALSTGGSLLFLKGAVNSEIVLRDIEKTKYFLAHEDELNSNIKRNANMTLDLPQRKVDIVNRTPEDENVFDINKIDIDNWNLEQLRIVKANIDREQFFEFDYHQEDDKKKNGNMRLSLIPKRKK